MFSVLSAELTFRQKEILSFISGNLEEKGYPPTIREIAARFGIVSLNAVRVHLKALEKKRLISLDKGRSRGICLLRPVSGDFRESKSMRIPHAFPLLGKIAAGKPSLAVEGRDDYISIDNEYFGCADNLFLLRVAGSSMDPEIRDGDMVVVIPAVTAKTGDIVVALIEDEATVKKLILKPDRIILRPLNPAYSDIELSGDFSINGKVVGVIRRY